MNNFNSNSFQNPPFDRNNVYERNNATSLQKRGSLEIKYTETVTKVHTVVYDQLEINTEDNSKSKLNWEDKGIQEISKRRKVDNFNNAAPPQIASIDHDRQDKIIVRSDEVCKKTEYLLNEASAWLNKTYLKKMIV